MDTLSAFSHIFHVLFMHSEALSDHPGRTGSRPIDRNISAQRIAKTLGVTCRGRLADPVATRCDMFVVTNRTNRHSLA